MPIDTAVNNRRLDEHHGKRAQSSPSTSAYPRTWRRSSRVTGHLGIHVKFDMSENRNLSALSIVLVYAEDTVHRSIKRHLVDAYAEDRRIVDAYDVLPRAKATQVVDAVLDGADIQNVAQLPLGSTLLVRYTLNSRICCSPCRASVPCTGSTARSVAFCSPPPMSSSRCIFYELSL